MAHPVLLNPRELENLTRLCNSPDRELASTWSVAQLQCLKPHMVSRPGQLRIRFLTDAAALKWNTRHETQIRYGGHVATAAVTAVVTIMAGPAGIVAGIAAGTVAAIAKDEVQARFWYPRTARGWTVIMDHVCTYQQFPRELLWVDTTYSVENHRGIEQDRMRTGRVELGVGGATGIPEQIARRMVTKPAETKTITFS